MEVVKQIEIKIDIDSDDYNQCSVCQFYTLYYNHTNQLSVRCVLFDQSLGDEPSRCNECLEKFGKPNE